MIPRCLSLALVAAAVSFATAQDKLPVKAVKGRLIEVRAGGIAELKMSGGQEIREVQSANGKVLIRPKDQGIGGFTDHFRVVWTKDEKLLIHALVPGVTRLTLVSKEGKSENVDILVFLHLFVPLETKKAREFDFMRPIKTIEVANEKALRVAVKEDDATIAVVTPLQPGDFRFVVVNQDGKGITVIVQVRSLKAPGKNTIIVAEKESVIFRPKNQANFKTISVEDDRVCRVSYSPDARVYLITGVGEGLTKITVTSVDDRIIEEHELIVRAAKD